MIKKSIDEQFANHGFEKLNESRLGVTYKYTFEHSNINYETYIKVYDNSIQVFGTEYNQYYCYTLPDYILKLCIKKMKEIKELRNEKK